MKTYVLYAAVGGGFCFMDERKAANSIFYSKQHGVGILAGLFLKGIISSANALALFKEVIALSHFPIVERRKGNIDWLNEDYDALVRIKSMEHFFYLTDVPKRFSKPAIIICPVCKRHAIIIGFNFFSESFFSREVGRRVIETIKDDDDIALADELRLLAELKNIQLPESVPKMKNPAINN